MLTDWWKPEQYDPYWMLEVRQGFDDAGSWLKNAHSCLTTRDPVKALRYPSEWHANTARQSLHNTNSGRFEATEHAWVSTTPTEDSGEVVQADREAFKQLRGMFGPTVSALVDQGDYDDDWQMLILRDHRLSALSQSPDSGMVEAAKALIDNVESTYRARNGRQVGIQADDGEKCWIIHSDYIFALEQALASLSKSPSDGERA